jgi:hypothetical protein
VRVRTRHVLSGAPVGGVALQGTLDLLDEELEARAVSDQQGTAVLHFPIPTDAGDEEVTLQVAGVLGDFRQSAETEVKLERSVQVRIDTDKPLYQPGQMMHTRLLALNPAGRAAADLPLTIRIEDPEDTAAHIKQIVTNRFGVAAADWQIPANIRLGDYRIRVLASRDGTEVDSTRTVKISRYDLPDFTVTTHPNRSYYLPGENAEIEVRADYLFGKPVPRAQVKVARETRREWDYRRQKWDIEEDPATEGVADSSGKLTVKLDLSRLHAELAPDLSRRFQDTTFTAYVRDPTSGRTEQRRFDLRVTAEPIHLYLIRPRSRRPAYVSASYADGKPAVCRVQVNGRINVTTNTCGVTQIPIPAQADSLDLVAEDSRGLRGHLQESLYPADSDEPNVRIETDKTLYRPGEPLRVTIFASEPVSSALLEVHREDSLLESRQLDLSAGTTQLELPWRDTFVHEVTIGLVPDHKGQEPPSRTVLFPANRELNVAVQTDRPAYRPGQDAIASLTTLSPEGKPVTAAVGVSVVDAAVGERTRSNAEFQHLSVWLWGRAVTTELAGISRHDLYRLDVSKPIHPDLDLLAEVMLVNDAYWPNVGRSVDYIGDLPYQFFSRFDPKFTPLRELLDRKYKSDFHHPYDLATLQQELAAAGLALDTLRDPWEQPYRPVFETTGPYHQLRLLSAGPDKHFGTQDDLTAFTVERRYFAPHRQQIVNALKALPAFPFTETATRHALEAAGIRLDELHDPWGIPYALDFTIQRNRSVLRFRSAGPDRTFGTPDDVEVDQLAGLYFAHTQVRLSALLQPLNSFPTDEKAWNQVLRSAGLFPLQDPWGTSVYPVFLQESRYTDLQRAYTAAKYGTTPQQRAEILPATETYSALYLRSAGPDRTIGTKDDFDLATFSRTQKVETATPSKRRRAGTAAPTANTGSIMGKVTDPSGAVIPGVFISVVQAGQDPKSSPEYEARSDDKGLYRVGALLPGRYDVRIHSPGFQTFLVTEVPVAAQRATVVDAELNVGSISESVTVEAPPTMVETSSAMVSSQGTAAAQAATPRLREFFPETLLWAPSLETDEEGRTRVKFRLADNITTWKLEALASTESGEIGTAGIDIRAFQPFFVDHAPPASSPTETGFSLPPPSETTLTSNRRSASPWSPPTGSKSREPAVSVRNCASAPANLPMLSSPSGPRLP